MSMTLHVDFHVPGAVSPRFKTEVEKESRKQTALALFKRGACSAGYAAKMLKMSLADFMDLLKAAGIPYAQGSKNATAADRRTLAWLRQQRPSRS